MIARKDLRSITGIHDVKLYDEQRKLVKQFSQNDKENNPKPFKDLFLCGPSGSGKTLLGVLRVKQMIWEWIDDGMKGNKIEKTKVYVITDIAESVFQGLCESQQHKAHKVSFN